MTEKIVEAVSVVKTYSVGGMPLHAVDHLNFDISAGEFAVILGPSGAGKTTLLNLIGGMDTITDGDLMVNGVNLRTLGRRQLTDYRRHDVGFVFQFYNLMPNLSALEISSWRSNFVKTLFRRAKCWRRWASEIVCTISPRNFPAENSSAYP